MAFENNRTTLFRMIMYIIISSVVIVILESIFWELNTFHAVLMVCLALAIQLYVLSSLTNKNIISLSIVNIAFNLLLILYFTPQINQISCQILGRHPITLSAYEEEKQISFCGQITDCGWIDVGIPRETWEGCIITDVINPELSILYLNYKPSPDNAFSVISSLQRKQNEILVGQGFMIPLDIINCDVDRLGFTELVCSSQYSYQYILSSIVVDT